MAPTSKPPRLPYPPPCHPDFGPFAGNFFIFSVPRVFLVSSSPGLGLAHLFLLLLCGFFSALVLASSNRKGQLEACSPSPQVQTGLKWMCLFSCCLWSFLGSRFAPLSLAFHLS